jgi:hypothetical protein
VRRSVATARRTASPGEAGGGQIGLVVARVSETKTSGLAEVEQREEAVQ